ncbi:MAG TPA: M50 family metallopeptidase [Candidatus Paceibacterota bacterium]|nr:M50 family metallopeptidase [Candidatus Paceibacterota bacterium]
MSILLFIVVLVALILVHELGHFVIAKLAGMRVDEFGIGYPPKVWGKKVGETEYTLNALPFGGFVKIYGEDIEEDRPASSRAFSSKPKLAQAAVLVAGVGMNLVFAWILISSTLVMGVPRALSDAEAARAPDAVLTVARVLPGSPAEKAGLSPGDAVLSVEGAGGKFSGADAELFTAFETEHEAGLPLTLHIRSLAGEEREVVVAPAAGLVAADPGRSALGVGLAVVGTVVLPWWQAPVDGAVLTWEITKATAVALYHFFGGLLSFTADLSQVAGPVGIAGAVGDASDSGLASLITITALISINLALINLLPIPALDGGRLLFVGIEAITRRQMKPSIVNAVNTVGFGLLILLMLVVTASDIFKIVG